MTAGGERLSAAALEQQLALTRARLSTTLARLDRDYALRAILRRGGQALHAKPSVPPASELVPLSIIAIGLIGWLLAAADHRDLVRRLSAVMADLRLRVPMLLALLEK